LTCLSSIVWTLNALKRSFQVHFIGCIQKLQKCINVTSKKKYYPLSLKLKIFGTMVKKKWVCLTLMFCSNLFCIQKREFDDRWLIAPTSICSTNMIFSHYISIFIIYWLYNTWLYNTDTIDSEGIYFSIAAGNLRLNSTSPTHTHVNKIIYYDDETRAHNSHIYFYRYYIYLHNVILTCASWKS